MKKLFICLAVLFSVSCLSAQEESPFPATVFWNQSSIHVEDDRDVRQCQAVRILPKWYLTAAHCVYPMCEKSCTIYVKLLQGDLQATARVEHNRISHPTVFYPKYDPSSLKGVQNDIALIHFAEKDLNYSFYQVSKKKTLDYQAFLKALRYTSQWSQWEALRKARPQLLTVGNIFNRQLKVPAAVPDIRDTRLAEMNLAGDDGIPHLYAEGESFYYFTDLKHYLGLNFEVQRGMSGGGVVLPGGAIVGIVSANFMDAGQLVAYDEENRPVYSVPYSNNYLLFTPFSEENKNFINTTISSAREGGSSANFVPFLDRYSVKTDKTFKMLFSTGNATDSAVKL